mgnify:CR=1 FL=1
MKTDTMKEDKQADKQLEYLSVALSSETKKKEALVKALNECIINSKDWLKVVNIANDALKLVEEA